MLMQSAERSFARGLEALDAGRGVEALALFEAAIEIEKRAGAARPQPRYLSYYGLCLALQANRPRDGLSFCREAASVEFFNPDVFCNLGRVLMAMDRRKDAYQAIRKGLSIQPGHTGLRHELERMGRRRRPTLSFLSRRNPINILLGKLTHAPEENGDDSSAGA